MLSEKTNVHNVLKQPIIKIIQISHMPLRCAYCDMYICDISIISIHRAALGETILTDVK